MNTIIPGVRQDHMGNYYHVAFKDGVQYQHPAVVPEPSFKFRFAGESKGHVWHFVTRGDVRVERCGTPDCGVCGPNHLLEHSPI